MTNMTRRNFLKSAGVMALAVAAAGVLSGCDSSSKNPVMADVEVQYWYESLILGQKQVYGNRQCRQGRHGQKGADRRDPEKNSGEQ